MTNISGGNHNDLLIGTNGGDTIHGNNGNDLILGRNGADSLFGDNGDDVVFGGGGNDSANGGNGNDALSGDDGDDTLNGGNGSDLLYGGAGDDTLSGGNGIDTAIYTRHYSDYQFVRLADGAIRIADLRAGSPDGTDLVSGVEWFVFRDRIVTTAALAFAATLTANNQGGVDITLNDAAALDVSLGTGGIDNVTYAGAGTVTLPENVENVTLAGTANSSVVGNDGDNVIVGNSGNNTLAAGAGDDMVDGGAGDDTIIGGSGEGDDTYNGGPGIDTVVYASATLGITVDLAAGTASGPEIGNDTLISIENIVGGSGADTIRGDDINPNELQGGAGNDLLDGRGANDVLFGEDGNDVLIGGAGADSLDGGDGTDRASYATALAGLIADLGNPANNTGDAVGDSYVSIENLEGSAFNDDLRGDAVNNNLVGGAGADQLDGAAGSDFAGYQTALAAVTASLASPGVNTGDAFGDTYVSIENLRGSNFNDTLVGDGATNFLQGGLGGDSLDGGTGSDFADYNNTTTGLTVDLLTPANNTGEAIGDSYVSIENLRGGALNDILRGDGANNFLRGGLGADTLEGRGGSDTADYIGATAGLTVDLGTPGNSTGEAAGDSYISIENVRGSDFNDTLVGDGANNFLRGGLGADSLNGGAGSDFADYVGSAVGLTVDLANPGNNTGEAVGDSYVSIENLRGSNFNDVLVGNGAGNLLQGGLGADALVGGAGGDYADYNNATAGLTVDLLTPANNTGEAIGDSYVSIENIRGSAQNDSLRGDNGNNFLRGGAGGDTLNGRGGFDTAEYSGSPLGLTADLATPANNTGEAAGDTYLNIENLRGSNLNDTLRGNAGGNFLDGAGGADVLDGGGRIDQAWYNSATTGVTASLANPAINTGDAAGDTYISIEGLFGSNFADTLIGDADRNFFVGSGGGDAYFGGGHFDTVGYGGANGPVTADLANSANNTGQAAGDTYDSIEGLGGGAFNDVLRGDGNDNLLFGNAGADALDGGGGRDGAGYADAATGVTADLSDPGNNTGDALGDTYTSIEDLSGSDLNDTLIGDDLGNRLQGQGGNDTLDGQDGDDTLTGESLGLEIASGDDTMTGGDGNDTLVFVQAAFGHDTVTDFVAGAGSEDVIQFDQDDFADFGAVLAASAQDGADVLITLDAANSVRLQNVVMANLHQDDFLLV